MNRFAAKSALVLFAVLACLFSTPNSKAETKRLLITQEINETQLVTLSGNTRPEVSPTTDKGPVSGDLAVNMMLLLRRPPELERSFTAYLDELQDAASPGFHQWLTADQLGQRYGLGQQDVTTICNWLKSHGFSIEAVYANGIMIDFTGTAAQVKSAFHTEIHKIYVNGQHHIANISDPKIPQALAPAIAGVVSLNNFMPHPLQATRPVETAGTGISSDYDVDNTYAVVPNDLATIYNFSAAFANGYTGKYRTIVLLEDTDVYNYPGDWQAFVNTFGLAGYGATFNQVHPGPGCVPPGINHLDDDEAALDVEYATAAAPGANIVLASCQDVFIFGGFLALQNLLQETPLPDVVSISFGDSESHIGAAYNAYINSLYASAAAEGVSVYVAAGDSGAAGSDEFASIATAGINVSGFASTPYNVAVGGTDFSDTYSGTNGTYWGPNNNDYGSALSYIPEIPWNNSCASELIANYEGFTSGFSFCTCLLQDFVNNIPCNTNLPTNLRFLTTNAGAGGPSGCATGVPAINGVVGGTCAGYPKPHWQNILGNPSDGVRDLPDVSLFAATDSVWGHFYIFCFSDPMSANYDGRPCTGLPSTWANAGGTSFASPIWAGIQALVNQQTGIRAGNPNPILYSLASNEYGRTGNASCNSSNGNLVNPSCIFYDVTLGDMDVECEGTNNCYLGGGEWGVLSTSDVTQLPAYGTNTGWDFATGIGTVNVYNLILNWPFSSVCNHFGSIC